MATKQTYVKPYPENEAAMPTGTHLRIKGLREIEPGLFEISGVRPRTIDHTLLAQVLGYDNDPELEDKVLASVWRFDMVRLLTDRIET
jgi:hypothetical protein